MRLLIASGVLITLLANSTGCSSENAADKIGFDTEILNEDGLYGPPDGLRSLDYEFCIQDRQDELSEVATLDPSLECTKGKGRIGCRPDQLLCLGNTHQKGYRRILLALARLDYVDKIEQAFFEQ